MVLCCVLVWCFIYFVSIYFDLLLSPMLWEREELHIGDEKGDMDGWHDG